MNSLVDRAVIANSGAGRRTKTRRNVAIAVLVAAIVVLAGFMSWNRGSGGAEGLVYTIPAGSYERVAIPGIDSAIQIPTQIVFKKGDDASITIVNKDVVDHRAGPFLVGAGQTYVQRFPEPGEYAINCSVDASESIIVTVEG